VMWSSTAALATVLAAAVGAGCGEGATAPLGGSGGSASGGTDAFDFAVYEVDTAAPGQKGAPVADAWLALDLPSGARQELLTGPDGHVVLRVPPGAEWVTWTVAKPGFFPVTTFYRARLDRVRAQIVEDGELYALMEQLAAPEQPNSVQLSATCPDSCCVAVGLHTWCDPTSDETIPKTSQPFLVTAFSLDADGRPVERTEIELHDSLTMQSVAFVFDGSDPTEPVTFDMTLLLPADPESPIAKAGVFTGSGMPVAVNDHSVDRNRGVAFNHLSALGSGEHQLTVGYFPKPGEELDMDIRVYPNDPGSHVRFTNAMSGRSFPTIPGGGSYAMLDIPRLVSPMAAPSRASSFAWQEVAGATMYELHVQKLWGNTLANRTLWLAVSWENQDITLPDPPAGYAPAAQWGSTATGEYRVAACDRWLPWAHRRLWWGPRAAAEVGCAYSEAVPGRVY
jgi:hypothetical protein